MGERVDGRQRCGRERDVRKDFEPKEVRSRGGGGGQEARQGHLEDAAVPPLRGGRVRVRGQLRDQFIQ